MIHEGEKELAQGVQRELLKMRSRPTPPTIDELEELAVKVIDAESGKWDSRRLIDNIRTDVSIAIGGIIESMQHERGDLSIRWATAIDKAQQWIRAVE